METWETVSRPEKAPETQPCQEAVATVGRGERWQGTKPKREWPRLSSGYKWNGLTWADWELVKEHFLRHQLTACWSQNIRTENLQLELLSRRGKPFQAHSVQLGCPANQTKMKGFIKKNRQEKVTAREIIYKHIQNMS